MQVADNVSSAAANDVLQEQYGSPHDNNGFYCLDNFNELQLTLISIQTIPPILNLIPIVWYTIISASFGLTIKALYHITR